MKRRGWLALPLLIASVMPAEDAVQAAATAALAAGRPGQALDLLGTTGGGAAAQALRVRAAAALGDAAQVRAFAGEDLTRWPRAQRGAVALALGQVQAVQGEWPAARDSLLIAIDGGGEDGDRALDLLAEVALVAGDRALARRCAELRWRRMPRTAAAAAAGLLLARLDLENDPQAAHKVLSQVRALPGVTQQHDTQAVELWCRSLVTAAPDEALLMAERALAAGMGGDVPLWRAVALLAIDPQAGAAAVAALPADVAARPEIAAARAAAVPWSNDHHRRLALAHAASAGGRWAEVIALVTPLAAEDPQALGLLLTAPDSDPAAWMGVPAGRTPEGASALARAWLARAQPAQALAAVVPVLDSAPEQRIWPTYWAWRSARQLGDARAETWARWLRDHPEQQLPPVVAGEIWADHAVTSQQEGVDPSAVAAAWAIAANRLPTDHAWWLPAMEALLRTALEGRTAAREVWGPITQLSPDFSDVATQRCGFLALQLALREGDQNLVRTLATALRRVAEPDQLRKLDALLSRGQATSPTPSP